jgi:thioredoxin 1
MRRFLFLLAAFTLLAFPATARDFTPYQQASFQTAVQSGAPVVVHVHAAWCSVCRRQTAILDEIFKDGALAKVQTVRVNYDQDRDFINANGIRRQGNILVFRNGKEVARVDFDTNANRIRAAIDRAL